MSNEQILEVVMAVVVFVVALTFVFIDINHELIFIIAAILFIALYMVIKLIVMHW